MCKFFAENEASAVAQSSAPGGPASCADRYDTNRHDGYINNSHAHARAQRQRRVRERVACVRGEGGVGGRGELGSVPPVFYVTVRDCVCVAAGSRPSHMCVCVCVRACVRACE